MKDHLGWLPMEIPVSMDGVDNPRPIVKQAYEENKVAIIHWVDRYRKSVCGKATWMTSTLDNNNMSTACEDIDDESLRPRWVKIGLICPECYEMWKVRDKDG